MWPLAWWREYKDFLLLQQLNILSRSRDTLERVANKPAARPNPRELELELDHKQLRSHYRSLALCICSSVKMWVYGWPLLEERTLQYAKEHDLLSDLGPNPSEDQIVSAVCHDISYQCNVDEVVCCWIGNELELVFALCSDKRAKSARKAKINEKQLPTLREVKLLGKLLKVKELPGWYRYDDGTFTPWDGELCDGRSRDSRKSGTRSSKQEKVKSPGKKTKVSLMPVGKKNKEWVECALPNIVIDSVS